MSKLMLHVGSGKIRHPNWVNVDHSPDHAPDLLMDALKLGDTYQENAVDLIFACHLFEHFSFPNDAIKFLIVSRKILKPGGILRLVVPDLFLVATAYTNRSSLKFIHGPDFKAYYHKSESRAERFHFFMTAWQHKMVYDFDLLEMLLRDAGFSKVKRCSFGNSDTPELRHLDRFQSESISVEATK